jgi:enterochelin esterase-like enzyme
MTRFAASVLLFVFLSSVAAKEAQAVDSPRLSALSAAIAAGDGKALDTFWREIERTHTPLIEPLQGEADEILLTFLWRARAGQEESNVGVTSPLGEMYRAHAVPEPLMRLPQTDVWFRTYRTSKRVRFEYALTWPQGHTANPQANDSFTHRDVMYESFLDPLNPKAMSSQWDEKPDGKNWADKIRRVSYAEGPGAPAEPFVAERMGIERGQLTTTEFSSALLGNIRRISIYTPPGLQHGSPDCDFLLMFDRAEYVMAVPTPTILDNMQADGALRPIVAVFVGNAPGAARSIELPGNPKFQQFLREELLPWIRARYRFTADPQRSVVGGSSFGGLAAAYTALTNPDVFGNVLSQSGSYWWWPEFRYEDRNVDALHADAGWMIRKYAATTKLPLRFYMDAGTLEGALMLLPNRMFRDLLRAKGYEVTYRELVGAHDYIVWRSTLSDGLIALLGVSQRRAAEIRTHDRARGVVQQYALLRITTKPSRLAEPTR